MVFNADGPIVGTSGSLDPSIVVSYSEVMDTDVLRDFAAKYIWWKTPDEALNHPKRVVAQVMELGTFEDMQKLLQLSDRNYLIEVLSHSEAGWFTPRSWHFWHFKLGLAEPGAVPPLPVRRFQ